MNGLLVLDELGTWLNSRNWNTKNRLEILNWLFLSRKDHWDLILLAQDYEMIDAQVHVPRHAIISSKRPALIDFKNKSIIFENLRRSQKRRAIQRLKKSQQRNQLLQD